MQFPLMGKLTGVMAAIVFTSCIALAGPAEDQARALLEEHQDAVVAVQLVIKQQFSMMGMPSQDNESKTEVIGTTIGPDGLTVLALSSTDPMGMLESMMGDMGEGMKIDSQISDVKLLLPSGEELQASIILRDKDLDLAFARPKVEPEEPLPYIDLSDSAEPEIMDELIALSRLGKVAQRVPAASLDRVEAVVSKPRTFYVPSSNVNNARLGSPAFTLEGKPVGLFVMRAIKDVGGADPMGMFGMGGDQNMIGIVRPAADILEAARQAPAFGAEDADADAAEAESTPAEETETENEGAAEEEAADGNS